MSRINYDLSKIKAIAFDVDGVLSPSTIPTDDDGKPVRMTNIKDGYALQLAVKRGLTIAIITGADSQSIVKRYGLLGIKDIYLKAKDKAIVMKEWMESRSLTADSTAYVGDDIPDLPAMQLASLKVAPADAAREVRAVADYISPADGGHGVARDLIEQILADRGKWMSDYDAFGW